MLSKKYDTFYREGKKASKKDCGDLRIYPPKRHKRKIKKWEC